MLKLQKGSVAMPSKNFFITGVTEMLFLSLLAQKDSYVYGITKTIEGYSSGLLTISPNTIYTVAYKLEQDGLISEYSKLVGRKRTRIYYHIEPKGREYLDNISKQYAQVTQGIELFNQAVDKLDAEGEHESMD